MKLITMQIGRGMLTIDHPASSYGIPVLVLDGVAYGPDDYLDEDITAGAAVMSSDTIAAGPATIGDFDFLSSWLMQSPDHGQRRVNSLRAVWPREMK